jgi:hypothetical protein
MKCHIIHDSEITQHLGTPAFYPIPFLDMPSHSPAFANAMKCHITNINVLSISIIHDWEITRHSGTPAFFPIPFLDMPSHQHHPRLGDYPAFGNAGVLPHPLPRHAKPCTGIRKRHEMINVLSISIIHD